MKMLPFLSALLAVGCVWHLLVPGSLLAQENVAPTIESVITANSAGGTSDSFSGGTINLISGTTANMYINGIVQDTNGRDTISTVFAVFYRSGVTGGSSCSADMTNCYITNPCNLSNNSDVNQKVYSCPIHPNFNADSTVSGGRYPSENWVAYVYVNDTGALFDEDSTVTKEIGSLLSLSIPTSFNFGTLNIGDSTTNSNNTEMVITQKGNTEADVTVQMAGNMGCTDGSIPRENIKWAITDVGYASGSSNSMTTSAVDTDLFVGYGTQGTPSPGKTLYWNISVPSAIGGTCTATIVFSTIAH